MLMVKPSIEFFDINTRGLSLIERAGRTCWKSEDKIGPGTNEKFVKMIMEFGHEAILEFGWLCYKVICDRGVTHEIVRHRLYTYAQESTRFCTYTNGVTYIIAPWWQQFGEGEYIVHPGSRPEVQINGTMIAVDSKYRNFLFVLQECEREYIAMLHNSFSAQQARAVLPNALKTEICMAANLREWRHFFKMRCSPKAHPQMQEIAYMILEDAQRRFPIVFDEFSEEGKSK